MEIDERIFSGKLKDIAVDSLSKKDIQFLLNEKIFTPIEYDTVTLSGMTEELHKDSSVFELFFVINGKTYEINPEIIIEIYYTFRFIIEDLDNENDWDINEILINTESYITKDTQIKYLEDKHQKLYSEIRTEPEFLVFLGLSEFNGYNSWKELILDLIKDEYELIKVYLKSDSLITLKKAFPQAIYSDWAKYLKIQELSETCKRKLYEIKNPEITSNLDAAQKVILFEKLMQFDQWADLSASKKAKIISLLIGSNEDNIKKHLLYANKPISQIKQKHLKDSSFIDDLFKSLG